MRTLLIVAILFISASSIYARDYETLSGERILGKDLQSEDKVVLLFWTTWCPFCAIQVKTFNNYCDELINKGFKIFLVNVQESERKVERFKDRMGIKCPIILDRLGYMAYRHRILGIPTYVFLKQGREIGRTNFLNKGQLGQLYND